jgi:hypothetical protein
MKLNVLPDMRYVKREAISREAKETVDNLNILYHANNKL